MYDRDEVMAEKSMSKTKSEKVVSVSSRGQATIPKEFREELGIGAPGRVKFVRTESGEIVVRPIHSATDLRGILADSTDEEGRSPTQRLEDERASDAAAEAELLERHGADEPSDR